MSFSRAERDDRMNAAIIDSSLTEREREAIKQLEQANWTASPSRKPTSLSLYQRSQVRKRPRHSNTGK